MKQEPTERTRAPLWPRRNPPRSRGGGSQTSVHTARLGSTGETLQELAWAAQSGEVINDQAARTIASWYQSPGTGQQLAALASGATFNTARLREEIDAHIPDGSRAAMHAWVDNLEALLRDD